MTDLTYYKNVCLTEIKRCNEINTLYLVHAILVEEV